MISVREANSIIDIIADSDKMATQRYLSSHQRDQVDLQAKMIISRCAERVRAMEGVEKSTYMCLGI
jgi:syntaxin 18